MASNGDISITLDVDWTEHPVLNVRVGTAADTFEVMAELDPATTSRHLMLYNLHVQAYSGGPNSLGWPMLRRLVMAAMEALDVDSVRVGGAVRTTGAGPGRRPRPLRFKRLARP